MPEIKGPTIKGVFVNSHLKALVAAKGEAVLEALEKQLGLALKFHALEDVPVRTELKIINAAFAILNPGEIAPEVRDLKAGHLHFNNFADTIFGKLILAGFPKDFKSFVLRSDMVVNQILKGAAMSALDLGPKKVRLYFTRSPYPLFHLQGFFEAWMQYWKIKGQVKAEAGDQGRCEYVLTWK